MPASEHALNEQAPNADRLPPEELADAGLWLLDTQSSTAPVTVGEEVVEVPTSRSGGALTARIGQLTVVALAATTVMHPMRRSRGQT